MHKNVMLCLIDVHDSEEATLRRLSYFETTYFNGNTIRAANVNERSPRKTHVLSTKVPLSSATYPAPSLQKTRPWFTLKS